MACRHRWVRKVPELALFKGVGALPSFDTVPGESPVSDGLRAKETAQEWRLDYRGRRSVVVCFFDSERIMAINLDMPRKTPPKYAAARPMCV
jgi:hypothetical protein